MPLLQLVIACEKDCFFPAKKVIHRAHRIFSNCRTVELKESGHLHILPQTEKERIIEFLRKGWFRQQTNRGGGGKMLLLGLEEWSGSGTADAAARTQWGKPPEKKRWTMTFFFIAEPHNINPNEFPWFSNSWDTHDNSNHHVHYIWGWVLRWPLNYYMPDIFCRDSLCPTTRDWPCSLADSSLP